MQWLDDAKDYLARAAKQFSLADLRWSYLVLPAIIAVAVVVHVVLPNGWTVWPLVPVIFALVTLNESVDRNGQGLPPLQVYAFIAGAMVVYGIGVFLLSQLNVFVELLGLGTLGYYAGKSYLRDREIRRIITGRREAGCCVWCGEQAPDPHAIFCEECGNEIDPERTSHERLSNIARNLSGKPGDRTRLVLTRESLGKIASRKEQALLANSPYRRNRKPRRGG